jgi:aryl carrier-like protein
MSAAVVAVSVQDETSLVAYLVSASSNSVWEALKNELRAHAAESLPSYSVPSYWLFVDELPMNSSGKVDHRALRRQLEGLDRAALIQLSSTGSAVSDIFGGCDQSATEQGLRDIWASVLELDADLIRPDGSFLALGGSSIRAIQVVSICRTRGWELSVADLLRVTTLRELASIIKTADSASVVPPYKPFSLISGEISGEKFKDYEDVYPASPLQETLVAATLSGVPDYLYQRVYSIKDVDISSLKGAMRLAIERDPVLRTTFISNGSTFLQVVLKHDPNFEDIYESLEEYKIFDHKRGVSLGEPFFRIAVLPKESLLVVTTHHSLFDYWSNSFFLDDAAAIYNGDIPRTRPPFTSFIRYLLDSDPEVSRSFWKDYLHEATPTQLSIGSYEPHVIERKTQISAGPFMSTHSVTFGALVYAAWALILATHTASNDVTFATTLSGRDVAVDNVHSMNGPTLTTVPQRVMIDYAKTSLEFVRAIQDRLWEMNRFSQFGMRNALRAAGHSGRLFDTLVNLLVNKDVSLSTQRIFQPYGATPVWGTELNTLEVIALDGDEFLFRLNSRLEPIRAGFIVDQFVKAVSAFIAQPHALLSEIDLVSQAELDHLVDLSPPVVATIDDFMHGPFERHAANTPHNIAIQFECTEYVSYAQLNWRANRLAAILRKKGVGPEVVVPFCLEKYVCFLLLFDLAHLIWSRSVKAFVCIFGVLKAGGAYTSLDPKSPFDRNKFIVEDVEAKIVLTDRDHSKYVADLGVEVILIDDFDLSGVWKNAPALITPENLAYVIYTSGM